MICIDCGKVIFQNMTRCFTCIGMDAYREKMDRNFKSLREIMEQKKAMEEHKEYLSSIDPVNHPPHYTTGQFEVINILEDKLSKEEFKGFLKGNILKYVFRADHKNGMEDYSKAKFYLDRLIEKVK